MNLMKKPAWLVVFLAFVMVALPANAETRRSITLYMTVDWEGWSLEEENLQAMRDFRVRYPHIPMLHLLNPVYFLRPGSNTAEMAEKMRATFLPADGQGLHLHGWRSLVEACEVTYRDQPAFSGTEGSCSTDDCGYNVSLELAYSETDLKRLVACSADKLVQQGFDRPRHFRAGGWQLGPKLALALQENGFNWDSSRIDASLLLGRWHPESGLISLLKTLHPDATRMDQPRELLSDLMQYPNNAALADYTTATELHGIFKRLVEKAQLEGKDMAMVLGFHQETADHYLPRLDEAIRLIEQEAVKKGVDIVWASYR